MKQVSFGANEYGVKPEKDEARKVSGRDGGSGSVEQVNCSDRATLSEVGEWTASVWIDGDATNTFHADRRGWSIS